MAMTSSVLIQFSQIVIAVEFPSYFRSYSPKSSQLIRNDVGFSGAMDR
jgi:uncharacterized protein (DUF934 family)